MVLPYDFNNWPNAALYGLPRGRGPIPLTAILNQATPSGGYIVNIGARNGDPSDGDPVFDLWYNKSATWRQASLVVEGVPEYCATLESRLAGTGVKIACQFAIPSTIASLLQNGSVPLEFELLKIDIDSTDCGVLEGILADGFKPKVVHMEMNFDIPPPLVFSMEYTDAVARDWFWHSLSFKGFYGCSLSRIHEITRHFGYSLVQAYGIDVDMVRNDLLPSKELITDPLVLYKRGVMPQCAAFGGHFQWPTKCHGLQALAERDPNEALFQVFKHLHQYLSSDTLKEVLFRLYVTH